MLLFGCRASTVVCRLLQRLHLYVLVEIFAWFCSFSSCTASGIWGKCFFFPTCLYSLLLIVRHNSDFSLNKGRLKHRHCVWDFWSRFPNACGDLKGGIRCDQPVLMGTVAKKASVAHLHGRNCPHKYVFKYFHSTQIFCIRLCPVCLLPETCHLLGARAWAMLWDALQ